MQVASFQAQIENRGLVLDPRTKLLLLFTMALFVLGGGMQDARFAFLLPCLCTVPFVLHISARKFKSAVLYALLYCAAYAALLFAAPYVTGVANFLLLATAGILTRFLPTITVGVYLLTTTTVSEFTAAMQRIHMSEKIIIPLSVMFRFFPTLADECSSINAAMRMRGVSLAGGNPQAMLEYRLVPMMMCSVKIGEELSAAALTRGLGGQVKRTNVCEIGFHVQDIIVLLLCAIPYMCAAFSLAGGLVWSF